MGKRIIIFLIALFGFTFMDCKAMQNNNTKYFKTTYDYFGNVIFNTEISESEYNNTNISPLSTEFITEYKQLSISVANGVVTLDCIWKSVPKYTSFDVIALRGENVSFNSSKTTGTQYYFKNSSDFIKYNINTANTKVFENGVGISMNLVDNASDYELRISIPYTVSGNNPIIYGSYQHAVKNVTLNTSQKYSLNSNGYGKVILFENSVKSYYDGMSGVNINL